MSDAYNLEQYTSSLLHSPPIPLKANPPLPPSRQNNSRLSELSSKVSALRGVTVNIYDNARDQHVIDNSSEVFSSMGTSIKGSAGRLGRMAQQGNKVAILKLAGMIVGVVVVLWYALRWAFGWR